MAPLVPLVPSSLTDLEANEIYSKAEDRECIYNNTVLASTCGNSTACLATKQEACCSFPPPPSITAGPMEEACMLNTKHLEPPSLR